MSSFYNLLNKRLRQERKEKMTSKSKRNVLVDAIKSECYQQLPPGHYEQALDVAIKTTLRMLAKIDDEGYLKEKNEYRSC